MTEKGRLVLVDGSGYIFRAFHALPTMTRRDGTPVNAVYGFTAMLMKLIPSKIEEDTSQKLSWAGIVKKHGSND